jgi:TatD DNase family protein
VEEAESALALSRLHGGLWVAAGIHPHDARSATRENIEQLARLWHDPRMVACGEMGLDYHYDFSPRHVQQSVFQWQLERAAQTPLPIVVHCREALDDVVRILAEQGYVGRRVVFHCFSGTAAEGADLRARGWWTSFTGVITFKNAAGSREACAQTPTDGLMFETDSPYLSPEPVRQMRPNEPRNLVHIVRFAAMLRGESFQALAETCTANAVRFFNLGQE